MSLLRLGSSTHSFDFDQRFVPLEFIKGQNTIKASAPPHGFIAPPGMYMLFILKDAEPSRPGVKFPSVAAILELKAGPTP